MLLSFSFAVDSLAPFSMVVAKFPITLTL